MAHKLLLVLTILLSGCSSLTDDIYKHTKKNNLTESYTAFIILSNTALNEKDLNRIIKDYTNETNPSKIFYYEYVLAKRTQEEKYVDRFISNAIKNSHILLRNESNWISISNPTLDLLSVYSKTYDSALSVLLRLALESDGANQSIVASNLLDAYKMDSARFLRIAKTLNINLDTILLLMEDE